VTDAVAEITNLSVIAGGARPYAVLQDVSFAVSPGEVLGVVGESGSGKTTLALAMLGHTRPGMRLEGKVDIGGVDLVTASEATRRSVRRGVVSYVQQDPAAALNPALRIGFQLRERLRATKQLGRAGETRLEQVLTTMQLPASRSFLRRYPHELSGGQLQRICIGMAVLARPQLIVLDEPTTGLDVVTQRRVLDLLQQLVAADGLAALYVTHDLSVVEGIADTLQVMYAGTLVEFGSKTDVLRRPLHPYTRGLIRSTPSLRSRKALAGIPGSALSPHERTDSCSYASRCEFVVPECRAAMPELRTITPGHLARCIRAEELVERKPQAATGAANSWAGSAPSEGAAALAVSALSAWYGDSKVLHDVNLTVERGKCLAIVGESGSGKTTLGRCISGLHAGTFQGSLQLDGAAVPNDPAQRTREMRRRIQYIFQNPYGSLNPRHTVGQSLTLPLGVFGLGQGRRPDVVAELLERVSLKPSYARRYPNQMSGGECQRVAIARALAAEPDLLVCDEITASLDVSIQAAILELLGALRRDMNLTLVFITHHLSLVRAIADDILILRGGEIVERGSAAQVLDHPKEPYTRELISNTPDFSVGNEAVSPPQR
jgi:peptide/nickel transport system ATP-binding protein